MPSLSGKTALVTGALTGMGYATAYALANQGAAVVVFGRNHDAGNALARDLRLMNVAALFIATDVRHEDDVRALVDRTVASLGHLDIAVNCAGVRHQRSGNAARHEAPAAGHAGTR